MRSDGRRQHNSDVQVASRDRAGREPRAAIRPAPVGGMCGGNRRSAAPGRMFNDGTSTPRSGMSESPVLPGQVCHGELRAAIRPAPVR